MFYIMQHIKEIFHSKHLIVMIHQLCSAVLMDHLVVEVTC